MLGEVLVQSCEDVQDDGYALVISGGNFERFRDGRGTFIDNHRSADVLGVITSLEPAGSVAGQRPDGSQGNRYRALGATFSRKTCHE